MLWWRWIACCALSLLWTATTLAAAPAPGARPLATDIAPQPLGRALAQYAQQTRLQLIYVSRLVEGRTSGRARAGQAPADALRRLLADTGLDFAFLNERTVAIRQAHAAGGTQPEPTVVRSAYVAPSRESGDLDEIRVTANKREESLLQVPVGIAVQSGQGMAARGIEDIGTLAAFTPGLQYDFNTQYGPALLTSITIRGISVDKGAPLTGVYLDDVPIQASFNVFRNAYPVTFDLDRVEVLRGPQGTMFGSNAPGGAVRFITKDPSTSEFSGLSRVQIAATEYGGLSWEGAAAAGGPIVPGVLGARASVWYRDEGGYVDRIDPLNGARVDANANRSASREARLALNFLPADTLRIVPSVTYQSIRMHDTPSFYLPLSDPDDGVLKNGKLLAQPHTDRFTLASLRIEQTFDPVVLTSVSGYFDRRAEAIVDETNGACVVYYGGCGNPLGAVYPTSYDQAVATNLTQHQSAFTEELRLAGARHADRLTWMIGAFLEREHQDGTVDTYALVQPQAAGIYGANYYSETEFSLFGRTEWAFSPRWRVGAGTRIGWFRGDSRVYAGGFANPGAVPFAESIGTYHALPSAPRLDLTFQPDPRHMLYAAVARGARAGGGNVPAQCGANPVPGWFGSDAIWNYEVGTRDQLFHRRLQVSGTVYYIRWNDIQEHTYDACGNAYTADAGAALSRGLELTADARLTDRWRLSLAVASTDARYTRTVATPDGQIIVRQGTAIGTLPSVPAPWTAVLSAEYRRPLGAHGSLYAAADELINSHNPGPFTENDPASVSYSPGFRADPATRRLDLRLGWVRSGLDIRLAVTNLLNSLPALQLNSDVTGSPLLYAYTFRPRSVSLTGSWDFFR